MGKRGAYRIGARSQDTALAFVFLIELYSVAVGCVPHSSCCSPSLPTSTSIQSFSTCPWCHRAPISLSFSILLAMSKPTPKTGFPVASSTDGFFQERPHLPNQVHEDRGFDRIRKCRSTQSSFKSKGETDRFQCTSQRPLIPKLPQNSKRSAPSPFQSKY